MKKRKSRNDDCVERKQINVLFTSVSHKVSLVNSFRNAYRDLKIPGLIVGVDCDPFSAAFHFVDKKYVIPRLDDRNFLPKLMSICRRENIDLLIPTRDEDLSFFSNHRHEFEANNIRVMVADPRTIAICSDKWRFFKYLQNNRISTIETWQRLDPKIKFPCIVKPRMGKGALGVLKIEDMTQLRGVDLDKNIIQEKIEGVEYTIDYLADFDGRPVCAVPRIRLRIYQGESKAGVTKYDKKMIDLCKKLGKGLKLIGHNTIQCFKLPDGKIKFLEVNPRFGGGAALGMAAGCKSPEFILSLMANRVFPIVEKFTEDLAMIRYSQDIFLPYDQIGGF